MGMGVTIELQISAMLSYAATLPLSWSTRSVGDKAIGACRLPGRERLRIGKLRVEKRV
jgi:hypothetical protein